MYRWLQRAKATWWHEITIKKHNKTTKIHKMTTEICKQLQMTVSISFSLEVLLLCRSGSGFFRYLCPGAHCLIILQYFLHGMPELPFIHHSGAVSESYGLPLWCHQMNATNTNTHSHIQTRYRIHRHTVLFLHFHPPPDKHIRWIHSSISTLT